MFSRVLLISAVLSALPVNASAITAEELVAKNLEARGGAAKLRAITTIHTVGKVRAGGGLGRRSSLGRSPPRSSAASSICRA